MPIRTLTAAGGALLCGQSASAVVRIAVWPRLSHPVQWLSRSARWTGYLSSGIAIHPALYALWTSPMLTVLSRKQWHAIPVLSGSAGNVQPHAHADRICPLHTLAGVHRSSGSRIAGGRCGVRKALAEELARRFRHRSSLRETGRVLAWVYQAHGLCENRPHRFTAQAGAGAPASAP